MRIFYSFILIVIIVIGFTWWKTESGPVNPTNKTIISFTVTKGESIRSVANALSSDHLIKSSFVFLLVAKEIDLANKIQAGQYPLSQSLETKEIALLLTKSPDDIWITIPEGFRADEIADMLQQKIPSYQSSWRPLVEAKEGYLFPDSYLISKNATIDMILKELTDTFNKRYATLNINSNLNQKQIVILASLIEREGKSNTDRPLIASVYMNRLKLGMALQVDATVQYALGYDTTDHTYWKQNLTTSDLQINSSYNTYVNSGLPPGPICNPGLQSLQAAANPASSDYLYYLADNKGVTHFAKTLDKQNANITKYGL